MTHRPIKTPLLHRAVHALSTLITLITQSAPFHRRGSLSRRTLLKSAGAVGAGLVSSQFPMTAQAARADAPRVVIVGAGLAGLSCAYRLMLAGMAPTVYEARDRVGGRVYSVTGQAGDGLVTELGAEFINSDHHDMLALVEAFGLELMDRTDHSDATEAIFFEGRHMTIDDIADLFKPYAEQITADVTAVYDDDEAALERFNGMTIQTYLNQIGLSSRDLLYRFLDAAFTTEYGLGITQQNALNFLYVAPVLNDDGEVDMGSASDERFKVKGGNQLICERAAQAVIAGGGTVELNTAVNQIVRVRDRYLVTCLLADGRTTVVEADSVVLAVPLPVLARIEINTPELTQDFRDAFTLGYGTNGKLVVGMDAAVWEQHGYNGAIVSDASFGSGWDSSELQDATGRSFTFFNGGNEGVRFAVGTPQEIAAQYLDELDQAFAGAAAAFNGRVIRQAWANDPHSLGSYSCPLLGQYAFYEVFQNSAGHLYLAGEHTSIDYFGYMNGAAESGRRVADSIVKAFA